MTLSLAATLAFWHDSHPLEENVQINSGAQVDESEDAVFAAAQRIVIQKCVAEIGRLMEKALGE